MSLREDLPLRWWTPDTWAPFVLREPLKLLNDHAHLERKAATNALELLLRWPDPVPPEGWVQAMNGVAIDEVAHLNTVSRLLARRGGRLMRIHRTPYAGALRGLVRAGHGPMELVDRLLVSALIEARSCERFRLLADAAAPEDEELARLYAGLYQSEAGHYRVFLKLAKELPRAQEWEVDARWGKLLDNEAEIARTQAPGPLMHSGPPPEG